VSRLTETLEGEHRGVSHFDGVTTVVTKLLNMVGPDVAFFGQKDAQQALVVRALVRDLDLPVRIEVCPTVREPDGLALSSRNVHLQGADRERAWRCTTLWPPPRRHWAPASATPRSCARPRWPRCAGAVSSPTTSSSSTRTTSLLWRASTARSSSRSRPAWAAPASSTTPFSTPTDSRRLSRHERTPEHPAPADASRLPVTLPRLFEKKRLGEPIVMVTAYDFPSARAVEEAGVDLVLVGDSGAMTVLGYPSTVAVELDELLVLARAARRGLRTPVPRRRPALRLLRGLRRAGGADGLPLRQGGGLRCGQARGRRSRERRSGSAIVLAGIPVMGHVGLTPQTSTALGGYRAQGRTAARLAHRARGARAAGGGLLQPRSSRRSPAAVAAELMPRIEIPVIGIGAGPATDGQVLVFHDLLGIREGLGARFVKRYASLQDEMVAGVARLRRRRAHGRYPGPSTATRSTSRSSPSSGRRWARRSRVAPGSAPPGAALRCTRVVGNSSPREGR
jgi:3-methyl-2-oxobutanoate hydroxymethyltransferase